MQSKSRKFGASKGRVRALTIPLAVLLAAMAGSAFAAANHDRCGPADVPTSSVSVWHQNCVGAHYQNSGVVCSGPPGVHESTPPVFTFEATVVVEVCGPTGQSGSPAVGVWFRP